MPSGASSSQRRAPVEQSLRLGPLSPDSSQRNPFHRRRFDDSVNPYGHEDEEEEEEDDEALEDDLLLPAAGSVPSPTMATPHSEPHADPAQPRSSKLRLPGVVTSSSTPKWSGGEEGEDDSLARYDPTRTAIENKIALITLQLDKQGFGRYQLCVWILAGFGYMLDLMWAQAYGLVADPISKEFNVGSNVADLSTAFSTGLTVGAFSFGIIVDVVGRRPAFYASCLISSCFGLIFAAPSNFDALCFLAAMIGFGIGGNIPVDGTIVVETIPTQKRWLVALLSLFQPLGVVICTILAYAFIPSRTCPNDIAPGTCTKSANFGWRTLMLVMGAITLGVFVLRFFIFHFHETPQFLLSIGDDAGALRVMQAIAKQNKREDLMTLTMEDFRRIDALALGTDTVASVEGEVIRVGEDDVAIRDGAAHQAAGNGTSGSRSPSEGADDVKAKALNLSVEAKHQRKQKSSTDADAATTGPVRVAAPLRRLQAASASTSAPQTALAVRQEKGWLAFAVFHAKHAVLRSVAGLLTLFGTPRLARVSSILFLVYICDFFAFSIAGFFLPLILADKGGETQHTIRETYASYIAIYAPGITATLVAGALYSLSRRSQLLSLIGSSALMAVSLFLYATVDSWASSIGLNALEYWMQSLFNAILYAYTPITYPSAIRGTGSGTCSTVGRIASIVAPIAGKRLYGDGGATNAQHTVYLAGGVMLVVPIALAFLPWETGRKVQAL
ncbi:hypothetical protein OC835_001869 [Tilletia horrida]|nr:hypothetical protein OC835_001869 [Tilletia horrida]